LISDPRFSKLWTEKEFERDDKERRELFRHITQNKKKSTENNLFDTFEKISDDEEELEEIDSDHDFREEKANSSDESEEIKNKRKKVEMYEIKSGYDINDENTINKAKKRNVPLGERVNEETKTIVKTNTGPKQMQFIPEADIRKMERDTQQIKQNKKRKRRSAKDLK